MAFRQIDNMLNMIQYQLKAFTKYEVRLIKHPSKNGVSESITDLIFTDKELYRYQKKNENQKMSIFFRPQSPNFLMNHGPIVNETNSEVMTARTALNEI